jgi:hypothetical protein
MDTVMHYGEFAFSKNGLKTIEFLNGGFAMTGGQRNRWNLLLTHGDISAIRSLYQCTTGTTASPVTRPPSSNFASYRVTLTNDLLVAVEAFTVDSSGAERRIFSLNPGQIRTIQWTSRDIQCTLRGTGYERTFFISEGQFINQNTAMNISQII